MDFKHTKIGILGGGQLGKMLCLSAAQWHLETHILDKSPCPAQTVCTHFIEGDFKNFDHVLSFGRKVDVITVEIEHVNIEALKFLEKEGKKVYPSSEALKLISDKGTQKKLYFENKIPTAEALFFENRKSLERQLKKDFSPFIWKARKGGYDGKGVIFVKDAKTIAELPDMACLTEIPVNIKKEISILLARNAKGEVAIYPATEMIFEEKANLLLFQICPAQISEAIETQAQDLSILIAEKFKIVGLLAIEFFLTQTDELLVNEVAPRPHNSGHHTIEACETSQFEQHLRAILNLPLGSTDLRKPAALLNLLGTVGFSGKPIYSGFENTLRLNDTHVHIYGKTETKPFRKMGHITVLNDDIGVALDTVKELKSQFEVISK